MFTGEFGALAEADTVEEEFALVGIGVSHDGDGVARVPVPVGEQVGGVVARVPLGAVEVVAVLGNAREVDDAEIGGVTGPCVGVVGRGLAEVVEARPDELTDGPGVVVHIAEIVVGQVAPRAVLEVVGGTLVGAAVAARVVDVGDSLGVVGQGGEQIDAARGDGGCRLAAEDETLRGALVRLLVAVRAVVESDHLEDAGEAVFKHAGDLVHARGDRARAVFAHADVLQHLRHAVALRVALGGDFVADRPHHDAGVVAEMVEHIHHVALRPLVEKAAVAVVALAPVPFIEGFAHDHEAHGVAQFDEFGRGHVVGGADGVAAHVAQQKQLAADGIAADGGTEGTEVVVQADALELTHLAVEQEAHVGDDLHAANTEGGGDVLLPFAVGVERGARLVEVGRLGRPEERGGEGEVLLEREVVADVVVAGEGVNSLARGFADEGGAEGDMLAEGVVHTGAEVDGCQPVGDVGGGDVGAPYGYVGALRGDEVHVAVEPCARVPTAALLAVAEADSDEVGRVGVEVGRDVAVESVVAVWPIAGFLSVDIDLGFAHGTIEEQGVTLRSGVGRRGERGDVRGVPRGAHVGETARTPRFERGEGLAVLPDGDVLQVVLAVEWSVDSPVVGDGDQLPRLVGGRGHLMIGLL